VTRRIVVTGADGYLGRQIAARLLMETGDRLVLTVRAATRAEAVTKESALRRDLLVAGADRVEVIAADLTRPEPLAGVDTAGVTGIVHTAARTAFTLERPAAEAVNVFGTLRVAEFARTCPDLERLVVLSTLFSAGRRTGRVDETAHDGRAGWVNHYEWSKQEAERELLAAHGDLPLTIVRLPTIVADDDTGRVTQYNVFHNTLKLFFYGLLSLMPGEPTTRQYLATADFASRGVAHLTGPAAPDGRRDGFFHLTPSPAETLTLAEIIDLAFDVFETDPAFRRRRLLRPHFCDNRSFQDLAEATRGLSASPLGQAIGSVAPFAEQMFLDKEFDNSRLRRAWPQCPPTDSRRLVAATCARLVETRWGRWPAGGGAGWEESA
jgi:nucleoside-diphosphate-sugar epimerase